MTPRPRILLAERLDEPAETLLAVAGDVISAPVGDEATLIRLIADCDALVARTHTPVTAALLAAAPRLRVVGIAGVGLERVDTAAAAARGIAVVHTPGAATDAVADLTLLFMLELLRPTRHLSAQYAAGQYRTARAAPHGVELATCTLGIVGMGRIGSAVARRCAAFGARVLFNDIVPVGPFEFAAEAVDKDTLWRTADIVTLHVPLTPETRGLVNRSVLTQIKRGTRLVNTARGAVVDTAALTAALQSGHLAGAALDVTDPEPLPADHPLWNCPTCLLTPHIAARTHGGLRRMCAVVEEVLRVLAETPPR